MNRAQMKRAAMALATVRVTHDYGRADELARVPSGTSGCVRGDPLAEWLDDVFRDDLWDPDKNDLESSMLLSEAHRPDFEMEPKP